MCKRRTLSVGAEVARSIRYRVLHQLRRLPEAIDEVNKLLRSPLAAQHFRQQPLRRELISMLAETGRYKEAIEQIEWLMEMMTGTQSLLHLSNTLCAGACDVRLSPTRQKSIRTRTRLTLLSSDRCMGRVCTKTSSMRQR